MDEYGSALISVACAVFSKRLTNRYLLEKLDKEKLGMILNDLGAAGEDEIAKALSISSHKDIEDDCLLSIVTFVDDLSIYIPAALKEPLLMIYHCWYRFIMKSSEENIEIKCDDADLLEKPREEFADALLKKVIGLAEKNKLSKEDKNGLKMLLKQLFYNYEVKIDEELLNKRAWPLIGLISERVKERRKLASILHKAIIRDEIWKGNLFVK